MKDTVKPLLLEAEIPAGHLVPHAENADCADSFYQYRSAKDENNHIPNTTKRPGAQ
jgi:hypothetical protein